MIETEPRIGELLPEHAGELLTLQRAAFVPEAQRYREPFIPPLLESLEQLHELIRSPEVPVIGAWAGHRLVGSVRGLIEGERMEVARFMVAPDFQGRGVGGALLTAIEAATPAPVRTWWLTTGTDSAGPLGMYQRRGYREVGRRPDAAGVMLVVLEKDRA